MKKVTCSFAVAFFLCLVSIVPAFALYIDFTDQAFRPNSGSALHQVTNPAYTIAVQAHSQYGRAYLTWYTDDGYGVHGGGGYEVDEIETPESLRISFTQATFVQYIDLTDLFYEERQGTSYQEIGWYNYTGNFSDSHTVFSQTNHNILPSPISNGEFRLDINDYVSSIWFSAPGRINGQDHDFSVAGLEMGTAPVPEPATLLLMGTGLIGLAGISRRRTKNKKTA